MIVVRSRLATGLYLLLLVYTGTLLYLTRTVPSDAQLFPYVIGVPVLALIVFKLGTLLSEDVRRFVDAVLDRAIKNREKVEYGKLNGMEIRTSIWMVLLFVVVYIFGILVGVFASILVYLNHYGKSNRTSLLLAAGVTLFIYVTFDLFLGLNLWSGLIPLL